MRNDDWFAWAWALSLPCCLRAGSKSDRRNNNKTKEKRLRLSSKLSIQNWRSRQKMNRRHLALFPPASSHTFSIYFFATFCCEEEPGIGVFYLYFFSCFLYQYTNTAKRGQTQIANAIRSRACYARSAASKSVGKGGALRGIRGLR